MERVGIGMEDRVVTCSCGQRMLVPASALGVTGVCVECGAPLTVTLQNSRPRRHREQGAPGAKPEKLAGQSQGCARCGRPFRGDWDRTPMDVGVFCYRCANLCSSKDPSALAGSAVPALHNPPPMPREMHPDRPWQSGDGFDQRLDQRHLARRKEFLTKYKGPLIFAAVSALVMMLVMILPVERYVAYLIYGADAKPAEEASPVFWTLIAVLGVFLQIMRYFVTLYLLLAFSNKLPNETFGKNLIAVGAVAIPLGLANLAALNFLLAFSVGIGRILVVWHLYQLEFKHLLLFWLLSLLLGPLFQALDALAYGILAAIAL